MNAQVLYSKAFKAQWKKELLQHEKAGEKDLVEITNWVNDVVSDLNKLN